MSVPTTTTGTIAGFGSIIINGTHYSTTSSQFLVDDAPGSQSDLSAGQVVTISGTTDQAGNHAAGTVVYDSVIVGPITAIDGTTNSFTALGQNVIVDVQTIYSNVADFSALAPGNNVLVSGSRNANGDVAASFVALLPSAPPKVRLTGAVANVDATAGTFSIQGETINFGSAQIVPTGVTLANGLPVAVAGTLDSTGTVIQASKVRVRKPLGNAGSGEGAEIEGPITEVSAGSNGSGTFSIGTEVVNFDPNTVFKGGAASDLVVGARVEAHGTLNPDGSLQARKIEIEQAPQSASSVGFLIGNLSAAPDTTGTPNTISLLGLSIAVTGSTALRDKHHHDQSFKLSDLAAGDRVSVAVALDTSSGSATPTLTALRVERADPSETASDASGPFANVTPGALGLSVDGVAVSGQGGCSGAPTGNCTVYRVFGTTTTSDAFFSALADPANANGVVFANGSFANGTLTASLLALQHQNGSGDTPHSD